MLITLAQIMEAFPESIIKYFVYGGFELILDNKGNYCISLNDVMTPHNLKRKFISIVSRCYKIELYVSNKMNIEFQDKLIKQFNQALGTKFTRDEIQLIYIYLGNGRNRDMADKFVASNFDIEVLKELAHRKETQKYE